MNSQTLLALILTMEGVTLISLCAIFYQLLKQQGRILLRLDDLEQSATRGLGTEAGHAELQPTGLSVGAQFPTFHYPDIAGRIVGLKDFEGNTCTLER